METMCCFFVTDRKIYPAALCGGGFVATTDGGKLCFCCLPYFVFSGDFSHLGVIRMFLILLWVFRVCLFFFLLFLFLKYWEKDAEIRDLKRKNTSLRHNWEIAESSRQDWRDNFTRMKEKLDAIKDALES